MIEFSIVTAERHRANAPAVKRMLEDWMHRSNNGSHRISKRSKVFQSVAVLLRCYRFCKLLCSLHPGPVVLPQRGHKYEEVLKELRAAGLSEEAISCPTAAHEGVFSGTALFVTISAAPVFLRCLLSSRLKPYAEVLTFAKAFTIILASRKLGTWIIIGDLSSFLIALAAACQCNGQRIVYWQYSYLDFKPLPVAADLAVLLNDTGRGLARTNPSTRSYWRPRDAVCPVRLDTLDEGPIGAMLNVHADHRALERLDELARWLNRTLEVRLHPNSALDRCPWPETLAKADPGEHLADFVQRHALLLGGNTQAQAKALTLGTPVVHCDGLDPLSFDHHGYVASGILPSCASAELPDMEAVKTFFSSADYARALSGLMGPEPDDRRPALEAFVSEVTHSEHSGKPLPARPFGASPASRRVL